MGAMSDALESRSFEHQKECRAMTTNFQRGSAKIYQFPIKVRQAFGRYREEARVGENSAAPNTPSMHLADAAFGSAWYHEEAVQDAERTRNN
jgi:Protein of unknown function (DUF2735)